MGVLLSLVRICLLSVMFSDILGRIGLGVLSPSQVFCLLLLWGLMKVENLSGAQVIALGKEDEKLEAAEKLGLKLARIGVIGMSYGLCRVAIWAAAK